jgi:hypothetical protein
MLSVTPLQSMADPSGTCTIPLPAGDPAMVQAAEAVSGAMTISSTVVPARNVEDRRIGLATPIARLWQEPVMTRVLLNSMRLKRPDARHSADVRVRSNQPRGEKLEGPAHILQHSISQGGFVLRTKYRRCVDREAGPTDAPSIPPRARVTDDRGQD